MPKYDLKKVSDWLKIKRPKWDYFTVYFHLPTQKLYASNPFHKGEICINRFIQYE